MRGIRANKKDEGKYISEQLQAIRDELKSDNVVKKANAVLKLTYLQMLGYDMSWASFNVVEVMVCQRFGVKRIGYLAASQSFNEGTDVLMLATNLIRKDFSTKNMYEAGMALNCVSNVCTPDLARDLAADTVSMLSNSKPYVRKRAVLALYRIFLNFPDSLRPAFPRLRERLEDSDPSVVCAAVCVLCELARKNPRNYLPLASVFFDLLNSQSYNNWMLIKIIKLFGVLTPLEPRLARLLVQPMHNLITSTPATSLLYECIQTCISGLSAHLPTMKLCIQKLRTFIESPDPNLKYLGLSALNNIMKIHPRAVAEHGDVILKCLEDDDVTIRARALDLLAGIVNKKNIRDIVARLILLIGRIDGTFRDEILAKIIALCHANQYANVLDFEWYLSVLTDLSRVQGTRRGGLIATQFLDVALRVRDVRGFAARVLISFLRDQRYYVNPFEGGVCEILDAAVWVLAEFYRDTVIECDPLQVLELMLQARISQLPARIQATFMQNVLKFFSKMVAGEIAVKPEEDDDDEEDEEDDDEEEEEEEEPIKVEPCKPEVLAEAAQMVLNKLPLFTHSTHVEVQERACLAYELAKLYVSSKEGGVDIGAQLFALFDEALLPVSKAAQRKVPVPEGLDLDTPFFTEPADEDDDDDDDDFGADDGLFSVQKGDLAALRQMQEESSFASSASASGAARKRRSNNPFILGGGDDDDYDGSSSTGLGSNEADGTPVDSIPVKTLTEDLGKLQIRSSPLSASARAKEQRPVSRRKHRAYKVMTTEDRPEGAANDDDDSAAAQKKRASRPEDALASISLDMPLRPDEELPVAQHHVVASAARSPADAGSAAAAASTPGAAKKAGASPFMLGGSAGAGAAPSVQAPEGMEPLCSDYLVQVFYELKTNPKEPLKVMSVLRFQNLSRTEMVARFEVDVPDGAAATLVHNPRFEKPAFALKPGQSAPHQLLFAFAAAPTETVVVRGTFHYMHKKANQKTPKKDAIAFELALPLTLFIRPVSVTKETLAGIIKGGALTAIKVQKDVPEARAGDVPALIDRVTKDLLHIEAVQGTSARALFYGKTTSDCHVAMMVRDKVATEGHLVFELKCSGPSTVAESLAALLRNLKI